MPVDNTYTFKIIGTDETKAMFKSLGSAVRSTVNAAGALGAGVAAGLAVMVAQSTKASTEMTRLAHSVGEGSATLGGWAHAASTVNIEAEKMADIFKDVQDKIGDFATTGGGGAADMFEKLNLDVKEFVGLSPSDQLLKIGAALDNVSSRSEKIFFLEALAGDASRLLPLLENNSEQLRGLIQEAEDLGVSISEVDAAKLEAANRAIERSQAAAAGFANKVAIEVAPIVEVLFEKLSKVGAEGDRLGKAVSTGFTLGGKAAGVLADGARGVQIAFKGVETLARGMNFVLAGGFTGLIEIINSIGNAIVDGIVFPIRQVLELAAPFSDMAKTALADVDGLVDKIRLEVPASMQAFADAQAAAFDVARGELHELLMQDLPSTVIQANIDRILAEADERAQQRVAEIRARLANGVGAEATEGVEDPRDVAERERIAARLQRLDESYFTELQKLQAKHEAELALIQEAEEAKVILEEEAREKRRRADEEFEKSKIELQKKSQTAAKALLQAGQNFANSFTATGSKKLFKVQKALALAQAAVALPAAVIQSYKNAGGYPLGIPAALAMAAKGAVQIASIKSQNIGSAGTSLGAGAGGGVSQSPQGQSPFGADIQSLNSQFDRDAQQNRPGNVLNLTVLGDIVGDSAEVMLDRMRDMIQNDDVILFAANSRQALELSES